MDRHFDFVDVGRGMMGAAAARHLAAFDPRPAVVFCTAYDAHALSAFEAEAIDYLVKPVRAERLAAALERVRTFAAGREKNGDGNGAACAFTEYDFQHEQFAS